MGMTMAEKILARVSSRDKVIPGEIVTARIHRLTAMGELGIYNFLKGEARAGRLCQSTLDP